MAVVISGDTGIDTVQDGSVGTADLANGAVTAAKLNADAPLLGYGQTWQVVTGSRALGTTYYNTTGKPILVRMSVSTNTASAARIVVTPTISGAAQSIATAYDITGNLCACPVVFAVQPGVSYSVSATASAGTPFAFDWSELR